MNTSDNQIASKTNLLSFAGTALAGSYLPIFIAPASQKKEGTLTILDGLTINAKYYTSHIDSNSLIAPAIINKSLLSLICEYIKAAIKSFTREQKLEEIRTKFNDFVEKSQKNFISYKVLHESCLTDIVMDIDVINRQKTLMKDYLLKKLFIKLQEMGLDCTFSDFPVEHIDLRDFPINDNYNIVVQENLSSKVEAQTTLIDILRIINAVNPYFYIFSRIENNRKIKRLEEILKELDKKEKYNTSQMNADLSLIGELECALKNIACIYQDMMDTLMPIMEKLLSELSYNYNNDFSQMPQLKVEAIRKIKDLLKDFSEVTIVPAKSTIDQMKDNVVKYSNNLSEKHYVLKAEMLKVAI